MKNKTIKNILVTFLIIVIIGLVIYTVFDLKNNYLININREGFDILLPDKDINSIAIKDNTLWAGGAQGLFKADVDSLTTEKVGDFKFVRAILATDDGLWVGHDDGLTFIGDKTVTYTSKNGLPDNRVNAIIKDNENRIWAGTWGGAAVLDGENIKIYTKADGLLENMVNVIMQDSFGGMWFGSYVAPRGGISVLFNNNWQYFTTGDALLHANVNAIIQLEDKSVISGGGLYTKGGATRFEFIEDKWVKISDMTKREGLAGEKVRSLFEDSKFRLWAGSEYDGLVIITGKDKLKLTQKTGLSNDEVKVIREDRNNNIWIGTREGLVRILNGGT